MDTETIPDDEDARIDGTQQPEFTTATEDSAGTVPEQAAEPSPEPVFTLRRKNAGADPDIPLTEGIHLVGRDETNAIVLKDPSVSRHHGVIVVKDGTVSVRDLDSKNHTFADGRKVDEEQDLRHGSVVIFGLVAFELVASYGDDKE